jgi:hypothetical protein
VRRRSLTEFHIITILLYKFKKLTNQNRSERPELEASGGNYGNERPNQIVIPECYLDGKIDLFCFNIDTWGVAIKVMVSG